MSAGQTIIVIIGIAAVIFLAYEFITAPELEGHE